MNFGLKASKRILLTTVRIRGGGVHVLAGKKPADSVPRSCAIVLNSQRARASPIVSHAIIGRTRYRVTPGCGGTVQCPGIGAITNRRGPGLSSHGNRYSACLDRPAILVVRRCPADPKWCAWGNSIHRERACQ